MTSLDDVWQYTHEYGQNNALSTPHRHLSKGLKGLSMTSHFLEEIKCSLLFVLIFKRGDHESVMTVILFQFVQYFLSVSWCKLFASGDAILNDEPRTSGVHNHLRDRWEADKDAWSHQRASLSKWHQKSERFYGILKESWRKENTPTSCTYYGIFQESIK